MKFPNLTDLDREQRAIYNEAPNDGAILVTGAPGTGKTVMAFHRAHKLKELGESPHVFMYNNVLSEYTSSRSGVADDVAVSTMHKWAGEWWRRMTGVRSVPGVDYAYDWHQICERAWEILDEGGAKASSVPWGHLIIDEGQDFPTQMYYALGKIARRKGLPGKAQLTVFADDNQRLNKELNSEAGQIRQFLFINNDPKRNFVLKRNFRNSLEIARFAAHFQVSAKNGPPLMPERHGNLPNVVFSPGDTELVQFIARRVKASPGRQIGVIVHSDGKLVKQMFNKVSHALRDTRVKTQMYLNKSYGKFDPLDFAASNTVTILHEKSAKGLEFDVVFYVGLELMNVAETDGLNERMALYVMSSRSRDDLYLVFNNLDLSKHLPASATLMPAPSTGLCRYIGLGALDGAPTEKAVKETNWVSPMCECEVAV